MVLLPGAFSYLSLRREVAFAECECKCKKGGEIRHAQSTGLVSRPVPGRPGGPGNGAVGSAEEKPKGSTSRRETTGQGKTGRVSASESSSRLRQRRHRQPTESGDRGRGRPTRVPARGLRS